MQHIRSTDSKLEIRFSRGLHAQKLSFRRNVASLPGIPDIVFDSAKVVVFIDSCFWHYCRYHCNIPKTNNEYWINKLINNRLRDRKVKKELRKNGWQVIRIWEHSLRKDFDSYIQLVKIFVSKY